MVTAWSVHPLRKFVIALCAWSGDICPFSTPDEVVSGLGLSIVPAKHSLLAIAGFGEKVYYITDSETLSRQKNGIPRQAIYRHSCPSREKRSSFHWAVIYKSTSG